LLEISIMRLTPILDTSVFLDVARGKIDASDWKIFRRLLPKSGCPLSTITLGELVTGLAKTAMGGIAEHFLELDALTFSARLAVGVFAGDHPTLLCGELAELRELVFDFLAFVSGDHTSIDRDSRVRL
jgi:hypothetical protein